MITYKGKPLTVVTIEMLVRTLTEWSYYPPKGSEADKIWESKQWMADEVWDYINDYMEDRPR